MEVHRPTVSVTLWCYTYVSYTVSYGYRITTFQEENVETTFIFQIIYSKEPIHQEDWQPSFDESIQQVKGQPSKIGGSLRVSPQQEV